MSGSRILLALGAAAGVILPTALSPLGAIPVAQDGGHDTDHVSSADILLTGQTGNADLFADMPFAHPDAVQMPDMTAAAPDALNAASDPDFISNVTNFGLFSTITAADPDDGFIAFVLQIPALGVTDILTSGADPENNLDLGEASIGLDGSTVNTLLTPLFDTTFTLPIEDPFADLFTLLVQLGF